ncbi:MAG TPA: hypothetical protein ENI85_08700 [Deltaproteobacteria bacterium]|nr:hypothetical protein [Deltaproteobacteria bacterium]
MTVLMTGLSIAAVLVPLVQGLRTILGAWAATRRVSPEELRRGKANRPGGTEPLALLMIRILQKSLREGEKEGQHSDFVFDATRQYILNEYDHHYARLITMYASLLPPIGFIGTTGGMLILFLSMHLADDSLELGALAIALTSSVFALIAYAGLEGFKIRLYARLLGSMREVEDLYHQADARREQAAAGRAGVPRSAVASA